MSVDRPTFHEAWYRVADLRPRLLSGVKVRRQHFRGQLWYVLENPANSQFARMDENAYRFAGSLDGRRTVSEVWQSCNEHLGDGAPTQGEVIHLLGQLHAMNLLYVDLPPDAEGLLNRYRRRVQREVLGYLSNLLFLRIPLFDPDALLNRWVGVVGLVYSWVGLLLWLMLVGTGLYFVVGNFRSWSAQSADVLAPDNLVFLYLSFVVVKICHEFSHAFACKRFGRLNRSAGEVHGMGVMFLVLFPLPYVDASSAWSFRNKWHRAIVGMAGVLAELAVAAVAAIVWAQTSIGTVHIIAYNVIFVARRLDAAVQRQPAASVRCLLCALGPDRDPQSGPAVPQLSPLSGQALCLGRPEAPEPGVLARRADLVPDLWSGLDPVPDLHQHPDSAVSEQPPAAGALHHRADPGGDRHRRLAHVPLSRFVRYLATRPGTGPQSPPGGSVHGRWLCRDIRAGGPDSHAPSLSDRRDCRAGRSSPRSTPRPMALSQDSCPRSRPSLPEGRPLVQAVNPELQAQKPEPAGRAASPGGAISSGRA